MVLRRVGYDKKNVWIKAVFKLFLYFTKGGYEDTEGGTLAIILGI